jgi:hypothetical protein
VRSSARRRLAEPIGRHRPSPPVVQPRALALAATATSRSAATEARVLQSGDGGCSGGARQGRLRWSGRARGRQDPHLVDVLVLHVRLALGKAEMAKHLKELS